MADGLSSFQKDFHHFNARGNELMMMEDLDIVGPNMDASYGQVERISDSYYKAASRGPNDVVLSGPITGGWGHGRFMRSRWAAWCWAEAKYGKARLDWVRQTDGRWAILVKGLKKNEA